LEFSPSWPLGSSGRGTHFWRFPTTKEHQVSWNLYCRAWNSHTHKILKFGFGY
jgi:hypothetical protein